MANLKYERKLYKEGINLIAGVDEAGRGPLVGPVVAACVILPKGLTIKGLNDSKKLTAKKREEYYQIINKKALGIGISVVSAKKIDEINIYQASILAMKEAIAKCSIKPEHVLIDAMKLDIDIPSTSIIHGDEISLSIAAASIIAKVKRDSIMMEMDKLHPEYGFKNHKGYATKKHLENIRRYGVNKEYRFTFKPICDLIEKDLNIKEKV